MAHDAMRSAVPMTIQTTPTSMRTLALSRTELGDWLRLVGTPGVRRAQVRRLLAAFGPPPAVFAAPPAALAKVVGNATAAVLLAAPGRDHAEYVARTDAWRDHPARHVLTLADPAYPPALLQTPDPPPLLYVEGHLHWLRTPAIAVVGSRHASAQGLAHAHAFAQALAQAGMTVISGLALGIDGAAHQGALTVNGATVAVLGTGIDRLYPARHRALARELAAHGALLTEWPLGTPPRPGHFPQRNRLIAGLARGVLVVEAAARSGSLITAHLATEMGRDVFAIPGSIHSALTKGCHSLIREGAKLVESVDDVLDEFDDLRPPLCNIGRAQAVAPGLDEHPAVDPAPADLRPARRGAGPVQPEPERPRAFAADLDADAQSVLRALGHDAAAVDLLGARSGLDPARIQSALLQLELAGLISVLPCGRIAPRVAAAPQRVPTGRRRRHDAAAPTESPVNLSLDLSPANDNAAPGIEP